MIFRRAHMGEYTQVKHILEQATAFLTEKGSTQWQMGYPTPEIVSEDIRLGRCWVAVKNGEIVATACVGFDADPTYKVIEGGEWLTKGEPYVVVHRVAVSNGVRGQGVAKWILQKVEDMCRCAGNIHSIRIDTQENNAPMRAIIENSGFCYCGEIYVWDGTQRRAYEKLQGTR